jgi:putative transposase
MGVILGVFRENQPKENTPMGLDESALSELLAALAAGDGVDLVRELAQWALQQLIDTEANAVIGAERWERTATRTAERNGTRPRVLATATGDLRVGIPKLRKGNVLLDLARAPPPHRSGPPRGDRGGLRVRRVDPQRGRSGAAMGVASGVSKSQVSRICEGLDVRVDAFRNRTLGHVEFPHVFLDATYVHVRDDALGQVVSRAVVVATGVTADGGREVLGVDVGDSEDETFWTAFLRSLKTRGLTGSAWSSPTPTPGSRRPSDGRSRVRRGSAAACTSPATCWPP